MTKTMVDVAVYVRELQKQNALNSIESDLAGEIRKKFQESLNERELVGIDYLNTYCYEPFVCGSHDYMDANMPVFEAVGAYCERVIGVPFDVFEKNALAADDEHGWDETVIALMNAGWDRLKKDGFSELWRATNDEGLRKDLGLIVLQTPESATEHHVLEHDARREFAGALTRLGGDEGAVADALNSVDENTNAQKILSLLEVVKNNRSVSLGL